MKPAISALWLGFLVALVSVGSGLGMMANRAALADPGSEHLQFAQSSTPTVAEAAARPVVVELYTSQGCSSCPPADELLGELAGEDNVLALSFHVDYWDYIGWKDTFASHAHTERQQAYAHSLSLRYVYTPQMIIDGTLDVVGSRKREVRRSIDLTAERLKMTDVPVTVEESGDGSAARIHIGSGHAPEEGATVWLAIYDTTGDVDIRRGENSGRTIRYHNVVREFRKLGIWRGERMAFDLDVAAARRDGRGGCAVIVQKGQAGPVLGAYDMKLLPRGS